MPGVIPPVLWALYFLTNAWGNLPKLLTTASDHFSWIEWGLGPTLNVGIPSVFNGVNKKDDHGAFNNHMFSIGFHAFCANPICF